MTSEDWNLVSYEDAESDEQVVLSPEFTASAVVGALHDSPHYVTIAAGCIPGTHTTAKNKVSIWLADHSARARNFQQRFNIPCNILWVHGPAGVGKTTLMLILANALLPPEHSSSPLVTVSAEEDTRPAHPPSYEADEFRTAGIKYGGTALFFSRDHHTDASKFFVTLAYGLARRLPPLAGFIQSAFDSTKQPQLLSADELAKTLILNPIKAWVLSEDGDVDVDLVIIIDGLDSFENKNAETEVVNVVREVFTRYVDGVRWLWIFSSRTEARLHDVFLRSNPSASPIAEEVVIRLAGEAAMKAYLEGATTRIRQTHPAFQQNAQGIVFGHGGSDTEREDEWPSPQDIATIQWQAAGLYAAASSMISYIANPTSDPRTRISLIEDLVYVHQDESDTPYTQLDTMYKDILAGVASDVQLTTKRILGAISCMQPSSRGEQPPTLTLLSDLLDITCNEVLKLLEDLHSVVKAPIDPVKVPRVGNTSQDRPHLEFHHRSFDQFLRTPARSLDWSLDLEATHMDLARCCLHKLVAFIGRTTAPVWDYAQKRWYFHCWRTGKDTEAALGILPDLFEFDFSVLNGNGRGISDSTAVVDRYFVEWLLYLQETTMSEWQLLNPGPFVELAAPRSIAGNNNELDLDTLSASGAGSSRSSNPTSACQGRMREGRKLPARKSYILGLEPAKQVYLVPSYDVKVQWRADLGQRIGPKEKQWDWIRDFRVVPFDYVTEEEEEEGDGEDTLDVEQTLDNEIGSSRK